MNVFVDCYCSANPAFAPYRGLHLLVVTIVIATCLNIEKDSLIDMRRVTAHTRVLGAIAKRRPAQSACALKDDAPRIHP